MPIIIAIIAVIAVLGIGGYVLQSTPAEDTLPTPSEVTTRPEEALPVDTEAVTDADAEPASTPTTPTPPTPSPTPVAEVNTEMTYKARGEYLTPARTNHIIDVTLTLQDGVVTDADVIYDEGAGFSNPHQQRFDGAYKAQVVGKRLDEINLSRVGGASVTSRSFNEVIADIEAQISA